MEREGTWIPVDYMFRIFTRKQAELQEIYMCTCTFSWELHRNYMALGHYVQMCNTSLQNNLHFGQSPLYCHTQRLIVLLRGKLHYITTTSYYLGPGDVGVNRALWNVDGQSDKQQLVSLEHHMTSHDPTYIMFAIPPLSHWLVRRSLWTVL